MAVKWSASERFQVSPHAPVSQRNPCWVLVHWRDGHRLTATKEVSQNVLLICICPLLDLFNFSTGRIQIKSPYLQLYWQGRYFWYAVLQYVLIATYLANWWTTNKRYTCNTQAGTSQVSNSLPQHDLKMRVKVTWGFWNTTQLCWHGFLLVFYSMHHLATSYTHV